jgi:hypothetical protein
MARARIARRLLDEIAERMRRGEELTPDEVVIAQRGEFAKGTDRTRYSSLLIDEDAPLQAGVASFRTDPQTGEARTVPRYGVPGRYGQSKGKTVPKEIVEVGGRNPPEGAIPLLSDKGIPTTRREVARPMLLQASDQVISPYSPKSATVRNPERMSYPNIYADPRVVVANASSYVAPENPMMHRLFGVVRDDLDQMMQSRVVGQNMGDPIIHESRQGAPDYVQNIMTPRNEQRLQDILHLSSQEPGLRGGYGWYELEPLRRIFVEEWGETEGNRRFAAFNQAGAGLSSQDSPVSETARNAWWQTELERGTPDRFMTAPADDLKGSGFGSLGHQGHSAQLRRMLDTGYFAETGPTASAKTRTYYRSRQGDPFFPTADAHYVRGVGLADVRPFIDTSEAAIRGNEAAPVMKWYQDRVAHPLGMGASPAQALQWGVLGPATGLKGYTDGKVIGKPLLELISDQVEQQALATGKSPEDVLRAFVRGEGLLGEVSSPPSKLSQPGPSATAYGTHEMIPGAGTGHRETLLDAPYDERQAFSSERDWGVGAGGQDVIMQGLMGRGRTMPRNETTGYFTPSNGRPEIQPGYAARGRVPLEDSGELPPDATDRLRVGEAIRGYFDMQNMGAGHIPMDSSQGDALRFPAKNKLTEGQMRNLVGEIERQGLPLSPSDTGRGVTLFDKTHWFGEPNPSTVTDSFRAAVDSIVSHLGIEGSGSSRLVKSNAVNTDFETAFRARRGSGAATQKLLDVIDDPALDPAIARDLRILGTNEVFKKKLRRRLALEAGPAGRDDYKNMLELIEKSAKKKGVDVFDVLRREMKTVGAYLPAAIAAVLLEMQSGEEPAPTSAMLG